MVPVRINQAVSIPFVFLDSGASEVAISADVLYDSEREAILSGSSLHTATALLLRLTAPSTIVSSLC